jgi:hypothetical protein
MAYLYRHIRLDKNEVFYIGIGSDNYYKRAKSNKYRNTYWNNIVNKTNYEIEILFDDLDKDKVIEKEIEFILLYGRKDLGLGTLVNMTNGGDGINGFKHSDESKLKISKFQKNRVQSEEARKKISESKLGKKRGIVHTEESKKKISEYMKNRIISDETRLKMSLATTKRNLEKSLNKKNK